MSESDSESDSVVSWVKDNWPGLFIAFAVTAAVTAVTAAGGSLVLTCVCTGAVIRQGFLYSTGGVLSDADHTRAAEPYL